MITMDPNEPLTLAQSLRVRSTMGSQVHLVMDPCAARRLASLIERGDDFEGMSRKIEEYTSDLEQIEEEVDRLNITKFAHGHREALEHQLHARWWMVNYIMAMIVLVGS